MILLQEIGYNSGIQENMVLDVLQHIHGNNP